MKEIAKRTGVSVSAVSKALAGAPDIGEQTRKRILDTAEEMGYHRLVEKTKKTDAALTIAVVAPDLKSRYYAKILESVEEKLSTTGGMLAVGCSRYDPELERQHIDRFSANSGVDGIICITPFNTLDSIPVGKTPIVAISQTDQAITHYDNIKVDDGYGIRQAVERFYALGHRRFAYLGLFLTYTRLNCFRAALRDCGEEVDETLIMVSEKRSEEAGYESMVKLLAGKTRPTAVFAAYDSIAAGAINALSEHGLRVPEDISVIGFDHVANIFHFNGKLTTIDCHVNEQAQIALSILRKKISSQEFSAVQSILIRTELVEQSTVAPVRKEGD